jgi:translation initiation factor IF-2
MGEEVQGGSDMTTIRVRDLSLELGISNKDLLQLLRDSHIHVKSHMSGLTDEEVDMVKSRLAQKNKQGGIFRDVLQKRVSSGVVLRRKKRVIPSRRGGSRVCGGGTGPEPVRGTAEAGRAVRRSRRPRSREVSPAETGAPEPVEEPAGRTARTPAKFRKKPRS